MHVCYFRVFWVTSILIGCRMCVVYMVNLHHKYVISLCSRCTASVICIFLQSGGSVTCPPHVTVINDGGCYHIIAPWLKRDPISLFNFHGFIAWYKCICNSHVVPVADLKVSSVCSYCQAPLNFKFCLQDPHQKKSKLSKQVAQRAPLA